jgi:beta-N-acetylglucosaminidase
MMLKGVIEGFFGRCWNQAERLEMMDWIQGSGMNLFVYAPKDDIKLRAKWREPYTIDELASLADLTEQARARGITMMVAVSPCVDITHSDPAELSHLYAKVDQFAGLGIHHILLLFDDIPSKLNEIDSEAFSTFAEAQVHVVNNCHEHLAKAEAGTKLYFCPTDYCGAFVKHDIAGSEYLNTIGRELRPDIGITWSGPDIISKTIDLPHILEIGRVLRRKPLIWDNFHANDYDIRRIYAGGLTGRNSDILPHVDGWMTNPNNEFEANFVPIHTTGRFLQGGTYDAIAAVSKALPEWQQRFDVGSENGEKHFMDASKIQLLIDLYSQPFTFGDEVEQLLGALEQMLSEQRPDTSSLHWQTGLASLRDLNNRLHTLSESMTEIRNRNLFYAFQPYLQDARIEFSQLLAYVEWLDTNPDRHAVFPHEEKVFNFYRMGLTASLNDLVQRDRSGRMRHTTG